MKNETWKYDIRCDSCGRFISSKELEEGGGAGQLFVPDSEFTYEEHLFQCKKCTEKYGEIVSHQTGVSRERTNWIH